MLAFPELAITGYPPEDLLLKPGFVATTVAALDGSSPAAAGASRSSASSTGSGPGDLYNAAAVCAGGRLLGVYHKRRLPNYAVFDEQRYFAPGADAGSQLFAVAGVPVGVSICEDAWSRGRARSPARPTAAPSSSSTSTPRRTTRARSASASAHARGPGRRGRLPDRLRQPGRRPGRAGLRRRLDGGRPRRRRCSPGRRSSSRACSSSTSTCARAPQAPAPILARRGRRAPGRGSRRVARPRSPRSA